MRCATSVLAVALALGGCIRADPNHCANQDRDATCVELGLGDYCSACAPSNNGCVAERPDDVCYPDGALNPPSSSGPSTTAPPTDSDDGSSSGPPPDCLAEGEEDPTCPEDLPYCIEGACATCDQASTSFCLGVSTDTPVCHEDWGRCVACTEIDQSACGGDAPRCQTDFTCGGCTSHDDCPASACDLERGTCMPEAEVYFVDKDAGTCGDATGAADNPDCNIADAIGRIPAGGRGTVRIKGGGSNYEEGIVVTSGSGRRIAVLGEAMPSILPFSNFGVLVSNINTVYLSKLRLGSGTEDAVRCDGSSTLWIDEAIVANGKVGVVARGCDVMIRRSEILQNDESAITLEQEAHLAMRSSVVFTNADVETDRSAIRANDSTFDIVYSTIAANGGPNVRCEALTSGVVVRNSVLVSPDLQSLNCPWLDINNSVHDDDSFEGGGNVLVDTFNEAWFETVAGSDAHVGNPGTSPFADVARWQLGDPWRDLDGDRLDATPGANGFAGADQP